jgi:hypothetical protein
VSDLSAYLAAAALFGYAAYRLGRGRRAVLQRTQQYGYGLVVCLAVTLTLLAPSMPRLLGGLGVDGTAVILVGDAVRTAAMSLLMFMARSLDRRPVRGVPVAAAILVQLAMVALFAAARITLGSDGSMSVHGTGRWLLAAHDLVFAGYAEWSLVTAVSALHRESRSVDNGPLRVGIRLTLAACAVGVGWAAWVADDVVNVLRSGVQDGSEDLVSNVLGALCVFFIVGGVLAAKCPAAIETVRTWLRSYAAYRRLAPLWEALRTELPQIVLEHERRPLLGSRLSASAFEFALYRRVIEIHDGRLTLRPYRPDRQTTAALVDQMSHVEADASDREALMEALRIAVALQNLRAGRRLSTPMDPAESAEDDGPSAAASGTVDAEAAWLARVSAAFTQVRALPDLESQHVS